MLRPSSIAIAALPIFASACVVPFAVPATRADWGVVSNVGKEQSQTGVQVKVGTHAASLKTDTDVSTDVGAGYIYEYYPAHVPQTVATPVPRFPSLRSIHGGYVGFGKRVDGLVDPAARAYLGVRGEVLAAHTGTRTELGLGASARLSVEFAKGSKGDFAGSDRCAIAFGHSQGTSAIGLYAEAGYRALPGGERAAVFTAGLTLRLPTIAGVAIIIPVPGC